MQNLSDSQVMLKYQQGEAKAMDELLKRYKNPVYHFSLRLSLNAAEAQDITQEVFLRLHQYKDRYRQTGKFSTWIFSIAHNVFVNRWRKNKRVVLWPRKKDKADEYVDIQSPDPSPQESVSQDEFSDIVKKCIQALPFLQKEALILREFEKLDYEQIARILNRSLGTVKTLIHRARMNLKNKLLPFIEESGGQNV
ncbi:MAG: sigma-70 family RNA polymerase sigma factor [Candidatus Omnitrophota bacterium]